MICYATIKLGRYLRINIIFVNRKGIKMDKAKEILTKIVSISLTVAIALALLIVGISYVLYERVYFFDGYAITAFAWNIVCLCLIISLISAIPLAIIKTNEEYGIKASIIGIVVLIVVIVIGGIVIKKAADGELGSSSSGYNCSNCGGDGWDSANGCRCVWCGGDGITSWNP